MSDPTRNSSLPPDSLQYGALCRIAIADVLDYVLTLPDTLHTEAEVNAFIASVGAKLANPNCRFEDLDPQEASLASALHHASAQLAQQFSWKVIKVFTPAELRDIAQGVAQQAQASKARLN